LGSGIPSCPCGDWAELVWKQALTIVQSDNLTKEAFNRLGIDMSVNEWKSVSAEAHYTVGIKQKYLHIFLGLVYFLGIVNIRSMLFLIFRK
jgi:hypothetical protein